MAQRTVIFDTADNKLKYKVGTQLHDVPLKSLPYKSYIALLSQSGTNNPTAIVFNADDTNYIGDIDWTRTTNGQFVGTLIGAFTWQKTLVFLNKTNTSNMIAGSGEFDTNSVVVQTGFVDTDGGTNFIPFADGVLDSCPIEIRVYS